MAQDDLAIRFSNETYATRGEVAKALGTSLIDNIWTNIIKYRGQFTRYLSLNAIDHTQLSVVLTPMIADKINHFERQLMKAWRRIYKIDHNSTTYNQYEQNFLASSLATIAVKYRLAVNDSFIKGLISNSLSSVSPERLILLNYYDALKYIKNNVYSPINELFLKDLYQILSSQDNLDYVYRQEEISSISQKALIGKMFIAAPISRIEEMMNQLFDFISFGQFSPFIKAVTAFYYLNLVKPFPSHSEEMALLVFKNILAKGDLDQVPILLHVEQWLIDATEDISKTINEVQKTGDITYLIATFLPDVTDACEQLLNESIAIDKDLIIQEDSQTNQLPMQTITTSSEQLPTIEEQGQPLKLDDRLALASVPVSLDENDARKIEQHLMETNPSLKRSEAYFYARHCTIGKYYTISQFKKALGCAYETARTSMDQLAMQGYYRKETYKNKFIYTPIGRKKE